MEIKVLSRLEKAFEENFQNKDLIIMINEDYDSKNEKKLTPDGELNYGWESYLEGAYGRRLKSRRQTLFTTEIFSKLPTSGTRRDPMDHISQYFISEISINEDEILKTDFTPFNNLVKPVFSKFTEKLFADLPKLNSVIREFEYIDIFQELFYISYHRLGLKNTLRFMDNFFENDCFSEDSRSIVEVILEAISFCESNGDYPIEWVLPQAFLYTEHREDRMISHE